MQTSQTTAEISKALCAAQGIMKSAIKDSSNPFFKSHYSDLASVREASQEPMATNGLSIIQVAGVYGEDKFGLTTRLSHVSGEFFEGTIPIDIGLLRDAQKTGSMITYLRRYSWQSILGMSSDDDDGEAAQGAIRASSASKSTKVAQSTFEGSSVVQSAGEASVLMSLFARSKKVGFTNDDWKKILVCLVGFIIARFAVQRLTREAIHAH